MNKRLFFPILITTFALMASCQREMEWSNTPEIRATVEDQPETKTSLSVDESGAGTIYWNPADKIDVFFGTTRATYTSQNSSNAKTATFKTSDSIGSSELSSTNIWGLYPSNSSSNCNGNSVTTTLPSTQYGVPNTFDDDLFLAVAHSTSTSLQFYNVCGGIKFNLAYDDIKKITFRGNNNENLAGKVSISFESGVPKATIVSGVKEITLTPKTVTTFAKGRDYYITLLPGTLSAGFKMTFTTTKGTTGTLNYTDNSVTIKRSVFSKKGNMDAYASFGDERQPNNVIYYTSTDGKVVTPYKTDVFGASIVSNEYVGGKGIITFDGAVLSIGDYAFDSCSVSSIEIPDSVTSIGNNAFAYCYSLTSISIPSSVTSIGEGAFFHCSSLISILIPASVTSIGNFVFSCCSSLSSIIVDIGNPVYDSRNSCNAIIYTATNTLISGCSRTVIPASVTSIGDSGAFWGTQLSSIDIPDSVTSIGDSAFYACKFSSIRIPSFVTSIGEGAFMYCSNLTSIEIPYSVKRINRLAFYDCSYLSSITVKAKTPPSLGDNVFSNTNCPIYVPAGSVDAYKSAWSAYADRILSMGDFYKAVDLGLSVKWASFNLGASKPEEYGDYYAWGETQPKSKYSWSTYKWCNGSENNLTKYNTNSSYGVVDNNTVLDLSDDAARANLGNRWRLPTDAEMTELRTQCTWTWVTQNGKNGYRVTAPNGNSIFLPAAGFRSSADLSGVGSVGLYWYSSSLYANRPSFAIGLGFYSDGVYGFADNRCYGFSVRPVSE